MSQLIVDGQLQKNNVKTGDNNMLTIFFLASSITIIQPKIVFKPIYIFNPIVIVVKEKEDLMCGCDEFILEDEPDLLWGELER